MSILDWVKSLQTSARSDHGDTETVVRIVRELDKLDPQRARFLASFAYVLSRVAGADRVISDVETTTMVDIVTRTGPLPRSQATLVVEIAKNQNKLFGGTEDFLVTREFRNLATDEERRGLLDCLFSVSAADAQISPEENKEMRQIASELGFTHEEYIRARLARRV